MEDDNVQKEVEWFQRTLTDACDWSMPRTRPKGRKSAYWWTEEIASLRRTAIQDRREFLKARSDSNKNDLEVKKTREGYQASRDRMATAIAAAKAKAWEELLHDLNRDPWGRPYKEVMKKLRAWTPPTTEAMDPRTVKGIVGALFPAGTCDNNPALGCREIVWDEGLEVSKYELARAAQKLSARKAPGPDGIPGRAWALALGHLSERLRGLFTNCLRLGRFPREWKEAKLVLLPKAGKPAGVPSAYRPICLLDEAGKMLERIVAERLTQHLSRMGPDLGPEQYGFRPGRSTIDAIHRVRALAKAATDEGGVLLAVSLDIANAFNTLPWNAVKRALRYHEIPTYLIAIVEDYFKDRKILYTDKRGRVCERELSCGVPQGSVLGPLLWEMAYDTVLRTALPPGCRVICYADDTLVLAPGKDWGGLNHG